MPRRIVDVSRRLLTNDTFAYGVPLAFLAIGLIAQLMASINHDTAWYLHAGGRYLEGGMLYRDIFVEVNPPLGLFLTLPPVILARLTGLFSVHVFVVYVYLLIALSLATVWWVQQADRQSPPVLRRGILIVAAAILIVSPADQFGQREHFLMILTLPYIIMIARDVVRGTRTSWPMALVFGLVAGVGFALKPHYLLVPLALEVYRLAITRGRSSILRAELLGLGTALVAYAVVLYLVTPDYLTRIVPYALEVYNVAYRNPLWINLLRVETFMLPLGCVVHLVTRRRQTAPHAGDIFLIASASFFVAYVAQMKGWDYHLYPASVYLMLGYASLFLNGLTGRRENKAEIKNNSLTPGVAVAALVVAALLVASDASKFGYKNRFTDIMTPYVERYAANGSIAVLGANVWPGFPMVNYSQVGWSSRFSSLWLLPGAMQKRFKGAAKNHALLDEMEAFTRDAVVADFSSDMPDLVFVDDRDEKTYFGQVRFDYLDYFGQDPRFARIWSDYVWVAEVVGFDIFRRRCAPGC